MAEIDKFLKQIIKGSGLFFLGQVFISIFSSLYTVIVARYLGPTEYGLVSLGVMLTGIVTTFSLLGLQLGLKRYIPHYRSKKEIAKLKGTIINSIFIVLTAACFFAFVSFYFAEAIALKLFKTRDFTTILRIFSLAVPAAALFRLFQEIFLGFKKIKFKVVFEVLTNGLVMLLLASLVIILRGPAEGISLAFLTSLLLGVIGGFFLFEFKTFSIFRSKIKNKWEKQRLFYFCFPLFLSSIVGLILGWSDTFIIAVMLTPHEVGLYRAAYPLGMILGKFIPSFGAVFIPLASELYSEKRTEEIRRLYQITKRWIFILALPLFTFILFFSKKIILVFLGKAYLESWTVLVVIALGSLLFSSAGLAYQLLQIFEATKKIFMVDLTGAGLNLLLNFLLIPRLGILGAAISCSFSLSFIHLGNMVLGRQYINIRFDPFEYLRLIVISVIAITPFFFLLRFLPDSWLMLALGAVVYLCFYYLLLILWGGLKQDDFLVVNYLRNKGRIFFKNFLSCAS